VVFNASTRPFCLKFLTSFFGSKKNFSVRFYLDRIRNFLLFYQTTMNGFLCSFSTMSSVEAQKLFSCSLSFKALYKTAFIFHQSNFFSTFLLNIFLSEFYHPLIVMRAIESFSNSEKTQNFTL
jgi:hypothetical protein